MNIVEQLHCLRVQLNRDPRIAIVNRCPVLPVFPLKYSCEPVPNERSGGEGK